MTNEEFRADLYKAYVAAGMHDPVLVQEYIEIAESFVFHQKKLTTIEYKLLIANVSEGG